MQRIGRALEDLGRLRNRADYQLNPSRTFTGRMTALDQVDADLQRRTAMVATIRSQFP
jgi:hypothetical protein